MRIALVVHAFPPGSSTGVEVYVEALARALSGRGGEVEVFAPRRDSKRAALSQTREEREGYGVTWLALDSREEDEDRRRARPGASAAFGRFLDREQPDVVHFQHFLGLGPELVDEARERDRPTLFTAHDYYALSNEYTLLAPDLSPVDASDLEAQVRCRLARGVLDCALSAHDGFLVPGLAPPELVEDVRAMLRGELPPTARLEDRATALGDELATRAEILSRIDHLEAPTRFLAERLAAGTREVSVRAQGIDLAPLSALAPPQLPGDKPLRVLYLGGYYEHKGVHVLLDACKGLGDSVQLRLRGCAGTSGYLAHLREGARACGAELGGTFERAELPGLLEAADLIVVPSLWSENAPFVIREAFAAGRPVIASDTPLLRESVRHGEDGLLFPVGDSAALRAALQLCATDNQRFSDLIAGVRPPRSIEDDAAELFELYGALTERAISADERRRQRLPAHLREFSARHARLSRLPTHELVARSLDGLSQLGQTLEDAPGSPGGSGSNLPCEARPRIRRSPIPPGGERLRERLAEAERAIEWRRAVAQDREHARLSGEQRLDQSQAAETDLRARAKWLEDLLAKRDDHLAWRTETLAALERTLESRGAELDDAKAARVEFEGRARERVEELEILGAERDWLADERSAQERAAAWYSDQLQAREDELTWIREVLVDHEAKVLELESRWAGERGATTAAQSELAEERARAEACAEEFESLNQRTELSIAERARLAEQLAAAHADLEVAADRARDEQARSTELHAGLARQAKIFVQLEQDRGAAHEHQAYLEALIEKLQAEGGARGAELEALRAEGDARGAELEALRAEMREAIEEGEGRLTRVFSARLARRLQAWSVGFADSERAAVKDGGEAE
jgi:glycosyltransferase involved in cell wall biosynthesis